MQESPLVLRIHRGRGANSASTVTTPGQADSKREKMRSSSSYTSIADQNTSTMTHSRSLGNTKDASSSLERVDSVFKSSTNDSEPLCHHQNQNNNNIGKKKEEIKRTVSNIECPVEEDQSLMHNRSLSPKSKGRVGKRNLKAQAKHFRMETKAAKTLAIIVGGFIVCWLPFFTVYLLGAFCPTCTSKLVFSILFYLGYCNSAINPVLYALFSKDFRNAFQQIITKVCCSCVVAAENYFSPNKRTIMRPPFPFPFAPAQPPCTASNQNSERFR